MVAQRLPALRQKAEPAAVFSSASGYPLVRPWLQPGMTARHESLRLSLAQHGRDLAAHMAQRGYSEAEIAQFFDPCGWENQTSLRPELNIEIVIGRAVLPRALRTRDRKVLPSASTTSTSACSLPTPGSVMRSLFIL